MLSRNNGDFVMNGKGFLLDTNAIIQLLKGNKELLSIISGADFISTSIISELEYFSFSGLSEEDVLLYKTFRSRIHVYGVPSDDSTFTCLVVSARKKYGLKLPDSLIAATARANDLIVLTADEHFKRLTLPWKVQLFPVMAL